MESPCMKYMYDSEWKKEYEELYIGIQNYEKEAEVIRIDEGIILPLKKDSGSPWGVGGGVVDNKGDFVEASRTETFFGGIYEYMEDILDYADETVIFIGVLPKHWGHYLLNTVSRLWFQTEYNWKYKVAFCGFGWEDPEISGVYLKLFELLGIQKERLIFIQTPTKFSTILIPEMSMSYMSYFCSTKYYKTIQLLVTNVVRKAEEMGLKPFEKIYFTRRQFERSRYTDVGEKNIERAFSANGYVILAPEQFSNLIEQVFYVYTCKYMASMSGSVAHNIMFSLGGTEQIILNRIPRPNWAQVRIAYIFGVRHTYIDCFHRSTLKYFQRFGDSINWMVVNENLTSYCSDNGMVLPNKNNIFSKESTFICNYFHFNILKLRKKVAENQRIRRIYKKLKDRKKIRK